MSTPPPEPVVPETGNSSTDSLDASLPPPPDPSSDKGLTSQSRTPDDETVTSPELVALTDDIFNISPLAAMKLLGAGVEALARITGDIPPTPPPTGGYTPSMRGVREEKESIVRSHSQRSLARMLEEAEAAAKAEATGGFPLGFDASSEQPTPTSTAPLPRPGAQAHSSSVGIDGVRLRSPTSNQEHAGTTTPSSTPGPYVVIGADSQPLNLQHSAITRKFYSKKPPPIGISDYLLRMHRFCPMSTAVYLATSLYIHRLAVSEKAIVVTRRNAHRLLLAGLRVAMKALEDLSYPHSKVARVGGVSDVELARLEISFCFLTGFELVVREEEMKSHWVLMKSGRGVGALGSTGIASDAAVPTLRLDRRPRGAPNVE